MNSPSNLSVLQIKNKKATNAMKKTAQVLFGIAVIGQLFFVYYIISFYVGTAILGDFENWNKVMHNGIIKGDSIGNLALIIHIFLAAIITLGGPIQFISYIRKNYPVFHRWNGRIYFVTAFLITFAGLIMIYGRMPIGGNIGRAGNTLNAILILTFSTMAWRTAMARNFTAHKKWALRAFLMVSGVWFFRIGFGLWIILNGGSAPGSTENLTGSFDIFLMFGHSLVPLVIIELYFFVRDRTGYFGKYIMTGFLGLLCGLLAAGIFMSSMIFWF